VKAYALRVADTGGSPHWHKGAFIHVVEREGWGPNDLQAEEVADIAATSFYRSLKSARSEARKVLKPATVTLEIVEFELREVRVVKSNARSFKFKRKRKPRALPVRSRTLNSLTMHLIDVAMKHHGDIDSDESWEP
jgi:hypothetical protein